MCRLFLVFLIHIFVNISVQNLLCQPLIAQTEYALDFFKVKKPNTREDIASMQLVLSKNKVSKLKTVYEFDKTNPDYKNISLSYTYTFDNKGNITSTNAVLLGMTADTLNKIAKSYTYTAENLLQAFDYKDLRGDEPNRSAVYHYDKAGRLVKAINNNPFYSDTLTYLYNEEGRLSIVQQKKYNKAFEYTINTAQTYTFDADTLCVQVDKDKLLDFERNNRALRYHLNDTTLFVYAQPTNDAPAYLIGKYVCSKQRQVLKYALFDPADAYLPRTTSVYTYYKSGELRAIYEYQGAGNLQSVVQYLPTSEISTIEYPNLKTKREYFYDQLTGLPQRTDMYLKGLKTGQIVYSVD